MSFSPLSFALLQQDRQRISAFLNQQMHPWGNQIVARSLPPAAVFHPCPPSGRNLSDLQLSLLRQDQASQSNHLLSQQLYSSALSAPLLFSTQQQQPLPLQMPMIYGRTQDPRLFLNHPEPSLLSHQSSIPRRPEASFSSPATLKREPPPLSPENQWEETTSLPPPSKRQRVTNTSPTTTPKRPNFPYHLMEAMMIHEDSQKQDRRNSKPTAFQWLEGGGFIVLCEESFLKDVLLKHGICDRNSKYSSFVRRMSRWGFTRRQHGLGHLLFHHDLFQKGQHEVIDQNILCAH